MDTLPNECRERKEKYPTPWGGIGGEASRIQGLPWGIDTFHLDKYESRKEKIVHKTLLAHCSGKYQPHTGWYRHRIARLTHHPVRPLGSGMLFHSESETREKIGRKQNIR